MFAFPTTSSGSQEASPLLNIAPDDPELTDQLVHEEFKARGIADLKRVYPEAAVLVLGVLQLALFDWPEPSARQAWVLVVSGAIGLALGDLCP